MDKMVQLPKVRGSKQKQPGKSSKMADTGKRHKCEICGKEFNHKFHLTVHLKIHADVKDFGCKQCSKKFTRNGKSIKNRLLIFIYFTV